MCSQRYFFQICFQTGTKQEEHIVEKILPYKRAIKYLCKKGKKLNTRKKLIIQKGYGFLFPILSVIIPLVTSLLRS